MKYLQDLGVQLDGVDFLAVLTELSAETIGELDRSGFISGWQSLRADTLSKQQATLPTLHYKLTKDSEYFRRVYRHSFKLARQSGQKSVALDMAIDFWRLLFGSGGMSWKTAQTDWLDLWAKYLETKWKKSVGKDMWDQTEIFARKCIEDESLAWWSEDQSWPGVLDDFVEYVREERKRADIMDVE
jgi:DCN1-like protein 1/2